MSRVAKLPVELPSGVEARINGADIQIKGAKGQLSLSTHKLIEVTQDENALKVAARKTSQEAVALSGTTRSLLNNMVKGVSEGFEKRLTLIGVGYRAQQQGTGLNLSLGFSHPVVYDAPEGISFEVIKQTEIVVRGVDKQKVGQVAAEIRAIRPPEPYKGKGVRYSDERVIMKEAKKK